MKIQPRFGSKWISLDLIPSLGILERILIEI